MRWASHAAPATHHSTSSISQRLPGGQEVEQEASKKKKSRDEITFVLRNDQYEEGRQNKKTGGERRLRKVSAAPRGCRHLHADCEFAFARKS